MTHDHTLLQKASKHAQHYLDSVDKRSVKETITADKRSVKETITADELRRQLDVPLAPHGEEPTAIIDSLATAAQDGTVATQGPRYFGFVVGSSFPIATAADWLVASWDQNAAVHVLSPFAAVLEQTTSERLKEVVNLPASWSVGYVSGATMANFTGLAAARHHTLQAVGWDVEADGLFGAPPVDVVVGEESHYTIGSALRLLGLGAKRVHRVPADAQGRMRAEKLPGILNSTTGPCIVCAQAGNVNTGAFDPIDAIASAVAERSAWLHVDGAFGLWAATSPARRHLVTGIERADSIATDAHKWLNVPYDCGIVLCAHPQSHRRAMTLAAAYIEDTATERDSRAYVPDESRRARAVPVYAVLRALGPTGLGELVDRCCTHAQRFAEGLRDAGYEVLNEVILNQVLVSFGNGETTRRVIAELQADGTCWCSGTQWKGRVAMRISVSSWATTTADVERSLDAMLRAARAAS